MKEMNHYFVKNVCSILLYSKLKLSLYCAIVKGNVRGETSLAAIGKDVWRRYEV